MNNLHYALFLITIPLFGVSTAYAGPPFITDDPEPVDYRHMEVYLFSNLNDTEIVIEEPYLNAPAIEANWGILPNVQLHVQIPYTWQTAAFNTARGLGDIELGLKYRFVQETPNIPQIAIFPQIELPSGNAERNLGNGRSWSRLPIWLQKSWGPLTSYGGGGWAFNSEPGMRNYPFAGWQVQGDLNKKLTLGLEIFTEGAVSEDGSSSTLINAGGYYRFNEHFFVLASAGHSVIGQDRTVAYFALYWTNAGQITY